MNNSSNEDSYDIFMNEVQAMEVLRHKNIVNQIDFGTGEIICSEKDKFLDQKTVNFIVLELA